MVDMTLPTKEQIENNETLCRISSYRYGAFQSDFTLAIRPNGFISIIGMYYTRDIFDIYRTYCVLRDNCDNVEVPNAAIGYRPSFEANGIEKYFGNELKTKKLDATYDQEGAGLCFEYGMFPQEKNNYLGYLEKAYQLLEAGMSDELREPLTETGNTYLNGMYKEYSLHHLEGYDTYHVRVNLCGKPEWYTVKPITWIYDKKTGMAISKDILFTNIPYGTTETMKFEDTNAKKILDSFSKEITYHLDYDIELNKGFADSLGTRVKTFKEAFISLFKNNKPEIIDIESETIELEEPNKFIEEPVKEEIKPSNILNTEVDKLIDEILSYESTYTGTRNLKDEVTKMLNEYNAKLSDYYMKEASGKIHLVFETPEVLLINLHNKLDKLLYEVKLNEKLESEKIKYTRNR